MALNFAEKTVFSGAVPFTAAQKATIIGAMQTAYNGSATAKTMFDNWVATGKTISIANVSGVFQAYTDGTGRVEIDLAYINDLSYVNDKGKPVLHSLVGALVHELGHALTLRRDNISATDYQGDNVRYVNTIWKELGLDKEISYIAQARSNIHKVGYEYTNGAPIDAARSSNKDWSSAPLGGSRDLLIGGASANVLQSGGGNDFLFGGGGDDDLRGDAGRDTAVYFGSPLDYDIRQNADRSWAVRNVRGAKDAGSDTLKNIEVIQFDGGKTYELKKKGLTFQTDFALVIDTTGSMGSSIGSVKTQASALIDAVFASGDGRIGVVGFKDTTNGEPSSVLLPFTDQDDFAVRKSTAIAAINSIGVGGGGDLPETAFDGLRLALNGSMGKWRPGSGVHRIALFTDAEAKDGALAAEVTALATSIGATISKKSSIASLGGSIDTFNLAFEGSTSKTTSGLFGPDDPSADPDFPVVLTDEPIDPDPTTAQVQIFTILTGGGGPDTTALSDIAKANGGDLLIAPNNDELVKKLLEIISAPPLATVSITANDPDAGETANPGQFTLNRTGILTAPLTVSYTLSGTSNSADYQPLSGTVVFAAGSSTAKIDVNVVDDSTYEGNETVIVTLATGGTSYQVDSSAQSATVTITDNETETTSNAPLNLVGTPNPDTLTGKGGNDTISGLADNDKLSGAGGNDTIRGGTGNDLINGDDGNDDLYGDADNDTVIGGSGNDNIYGGDGNDSVVGGLGRDYVIGDAGNDTVEGGYGNDYVYGGAGNDRVLGGSDDDYLDGGIGNDYVDGENGADFVTGGYSSDTVVGGLGNDTVDGGAGADLDNLFGGAGVDTFVLSKRASDNINDFAAGEFLQVSASAFGGGLVAGAALTSAQLLVGAGSATAATRFIYNGGELFFDADGSGVGIAAKVATLAGSPGLSTSNFVLFK